MGRGSRERGGGSEESTALAGEEGRGPYVGRRPFEEMSNFDPESSHDKMAFPEPSPASSDLPKLPHPVYKDPNQMLTVSEPSLHLRVLKACSFSFRRGKRNPLGKILLKC